MYQHQLFDVVYQIFFLIYLIVHLKMSPFPFIWGKASVCGVKQSTPANWKLLAAGDSNLILPIE